MLLQNRPLLSYIRGGEEARGTFRFMSEQLFGRELSFEEVHPAVPFPIVRSSASSLLPSNSSGTALVTEYLRAHGYTVYHDMTAYDRKDGKDNRNYAFPEVLVVAVIFQINAVHQIRVEYPADQIELQAERQISNQIRILQIGDGAGGARCRSCLTAAGCWRRI